MRMQVVAGSNNADTMTIRELTKQVPTRLIRLMLRIAQLQRGRYMVLLSVGDDAIEWSVCPVEKVER